MSAIPKVTVKFGDRLKRIPTIQSREDFVDCLQDAFGPESVKHADLIFLIGKETSEDGTEEVFKMKLDAALAAKLNSDPQDTPFELETRPHPELEKLAKSGMQKEGATGDDKQHGQNNDYNELLSVQDRRRAALVKKGREQGTKRDALGRVISTKISTKGQNVHSQLANQQTQEYRKYIHLHWKKNEKSGVPYRLEDQDQRVVQLSYMEMRKNPVLRGRPDSVLNRMAQK